MTSMPARSQQFVVLSVVALLVWGAAAVSAEVLAEWDPGLRRLTVRGDGANDTIVIGCPNGRAGSVTLNAQPLDEPATCADVASLVVDGGGGDDTIYLGTIDAAAFPALASVSIDGGAGDDVVTGSRLPDRIAGGPGSDEIDALGGADELDGGDGDDVLRGGNGDDAYLFPPATAEETDRAYEYLDHGVDVLDFSRETAPVLSDLAEEGFLAQAGDRLVLTSTGQGVTTGGGLGFEDILGGSGNDTIEGNVNANRLEGGGGDDVVFALSNNDVVVGGPGDDTLEGGDQDDALAGGDGDDRIGGGRGGDRVEFGAGRDALVDGIADDAVLAPTGLTSGVLVDTFVDVPESVSLEAWDGGHTMDATRFGGEAILLGSRGDDRLLGGPGRNWILGYDGSDVIDGGGGPDDLEGGEDQDVVLGGPGSDRVDGGPGSDRVGGGPGTNVVVSTGSYGSARDRDVLLGSGSFVRLTRSTLQDEGITFHSGFDAAEVSGGRGDDRLDAAAFAGPVTLAGGPGRDRLIGGQAGDLLRGGGGDDRISGGRGRDVLLGGRGNDHLDGGPNRDILVGGPGRDTFRAMPGRDAVRP